MALTNPAPTWEAVASMLVAQAVTVAMAPVKAVGSVTVKKLASVCPAVETKFRMPVPRSTQNCRKGSQVFHR